MAAALAATAAARLAPALRSAGGRFLGSSSASVRSMGGKMMNMTDAKVTAGLEKLSKSMNVMVKVLATVGKAVYKIVSFLAKHSPALKQQLIVMQKGLSLMIRPIGDIMAKFMRPMSIWVMKVAQKWYSMFGTGGGDTTSSMYKEDKVKQLKVEQESAMLRGDTAGAASIQKQIDSLGSGKSSGPKNMFSDVFASMDMMKSKLDETFGQTTMGKISDGITKFMSDIWSKLLPDSAKEAWAAIVESGTAFWQVLKDLWSVIQPILEPIGKFLAIITGLALVGALKIVTGLFKSITLKLQAVSLVLKTVRLGWDTLKTSMAVFIDWLGSKFTENWTILKEKMSELYDWLQNTFNKIWSTIKSSMKTFFDWLNGKVNWLKNLNPFAKSEGENGGGGVSGDFATGGFIDKSGLYQLHAGERVINAGDTSRQREANKSISFSTVINLQATINNDLDINQLARRLADLNETELRRRVSYM